MMYVVRHGETEWNKSNKVMGKIDKPINKTGEVQAEKIRDKLKDKKIDLIICSPLLRTRQTAAIINKDINVDIIYDNRISERDFGEFEGLNIKDFDFNSFWTFNKKKYKNAENITDFFDRIHNFLDDITKKYPNKNILIVTHGGVGLTIDCYFNKKIPNNSLINAKNRFLNGEIKEYKNA